MKPLERVRSPRAGHNIWVFHKSFSNLCVRSKETHTAHVPAQVTTGACLFRSGTYRAWKDKKDMSFSRKVSPGSEETIGFYKKETAAARGRECVSLWVMHSQSPAIHVLEHAGARHLHRGERQEGLNTLTGWCLGFSRFSASPSFDLINLRNEGEGEY